MFRRLLLTVSVTACLCGVYAVYALTVTPLLTPPQIEAPRPVLRTTGPVTSETPIYERLAAKWLGQHAWAQSARYKVGRGRAYLYSEDWEKVQPSGHIRFRPFAMVYLGEQPDEEPMVVVSDSALLEFSEPFDETNPKLGRLVGGALEGAVEIDGAKGLSIRTRNVRFSESGLLVWSDEPIEFRLGQNHGRGLGLEMNLLPGPPTDEKPGVSGIRTLRLRKDVVLDLRSKPRGPEGKVEQARITSAGKFEYHLAERMALFQEKVHLDHPGRESGVDSLDCHELLVVFEPKTEPGAAAPPPPADGTDDDMEGLSFRRMRAVADPAGTQPVKLVSPRADLIAHCSELTYDAVLRVATLKDGRQVKVTQKRNDLYSPEITIVHEEKGGRIIEALCRGNGRVESFGTLPGKPHARGPLAFSGTWLTQLHKFPDKETGLDLIEFQGQASLNQPGQIQLGGDLIKIWITPDKPEKPKDENGEELVASADDSRTAQVQRVEAHRGVTFAAEKLEGKSEQLVITLEDGKLPIPRPAPVAGKEGVKTSWWGTKGPVSLVERDAPMGRARGFAYVDDPAAGRAGKTVPASRSEPARRSAEPGRLKPVAGPSAAAVKSPPLHVEARTIRVKMIRDGQETDAAEVETEGAVKVIQPRTGGTKPVEVHGDWMKLLNYANDEQVVHVIGKPAEVIDPQMELRGKDLHLDRGANTVRVDGAGTLKLPMTKGMDGQVLTKPQWLTVAWERQMTFDGLLARFEQDVSAVLEESRMNCHEMDVTFTRKVSFLEGTETTGTTGADAGGPRIAGSAAVSPPSGRPSGAEIERIHCKEGVNLFAYEYDVDRKLKAYRTGEVYEFTLHQPTGDTTATGPGKMFMWWRGDAVRENLGATATVRANRSRQTDRPAWNYAKIEFADTMRGNAKERISLFQDRVRVLYGPVGNTGEHIDADHLPVNAGWLRSNMLRLVQVQGQGGNFMEMVGQGNAELDGRTGNGLFHALADTVTFDESKGMYILRSEGNRKAAIWRQVSLGSPRSHAEATYMEFNPSRNSLKLDKATGLDGLQ